MSLKDRREGRSERDVQGGYSPARPGRGKRSGGRASRFVGPVLIACAIIAVLVAADYFVNSGKIYRGVEVGTVPLGGETPAEARDSVQERATGALKEIELSGPELFTRTASEMGVSFNVGKTVDDAYAVGRGGNIMERLGERARALVFGVTIPPDYNYRPEKARAEVSEIAAQLNERPREAEVNIYGAEAEVVESREGYELDNAATMVNVNGAVEDMSGEAKIAGDVLQPNVNTQEAEAAADEVRAATSEQLVFTHEDERWTLSPADIGSSLEVTREGGKLEVSLNRDELDERLANVYADLTIKPVDASYEFDDEGNVVVTQSKEGRTVEKEKLLDAVENGLFDGKREYQVTTTSDAPRYTTAGLEAKKPTELLGTYKTNYTATTDQGAERVANLQIASNAVSGVFVAPGETFSMLEHVTNLDYEQAHVIVDGAETTADGGGLCQVTSTLYNAALYAGMEITERTAHASQLPYIRPGMDATVWYGDVSTTADDLDMKFRNTTDGYILIQEIVSDDGYIYANIYGVPDNIEVQMSSEEVWMTEDASEWITYYTRTKNGEVVYEDSWNTEYDALTDDKGKKIPTPKVPIAEIDGTYLGPEF